MSDFQVRSSEELLEHAEILYRFVALFSDYEHATRDYGAQDMMSMSEIHILVAINEHPGITGAELADAFFITPSAVSQVLSRMESREYIVRVTKKGKRKMIFCTMKGKELCDAHRAFDIKALTKTYNYLLRDCNPSEIRSFYKVMNIYNNIMMAGRKKRLRALATENNAQSK